MTNKPKYTGKIDIAAWENKDKNGKPYLSLKIGNVSIPLWLNDNTNYGLPDHVDPEEIANDR